MKTGGLKSMDSHNNQLRRGLDERHMHMIALGGAIGTGLFYGSATTIQMTGPAITLAYLIGGVVIFFIMRALGEMTLAEPVSGSISHYAGRYIGPFAGFLAGWTYWFMWIIVGMAELTAIGTYFQYWFPSVPQWVPSLVALVLMTLVNLLHVKAFGEFEFWFASIKVFAILAMMGGGLLLIFGPIDHGSTSTGVDNLFAHGGFMPHGWKGFLLSMVLVFFSFGGVELVGMTAGEAKNPLKSIPAAVNKVIWRILIFYVGALTIMLMLYPWNEIGTKGSPFVMIFDQIGIPATATILNIVVITAALSAFNSGLFSTSRMLYHLGLEGQAPRIFTKLNKAHAPQRGILFSSLLLSVAVVLNYLVPEKVFLYISSVATVAVITSWALILLTHLRFRKANRTTAFNMPFYPYSSYFALAFLGIVVILMAYVDSTVIALIVAPVWYLLVFVSYHVRQRIATKREKPAATS
nr:amino acid permease [Laceyella tengchongensis]